MTDTSRRLEAPAHYDDTRRALWAQTVDRLRRGDRGEVFRADPHMIAAYVEAVAAHQQASKILAQTNVLITRDGQARENPALQVQRRTAADMAAAARRLGLHRDPLLAPVAESPLRGDGRRWCDQHHRDECKHQRKAGRGPCHSPHVIPGTGSCRMHAGKSADRAREDGRVALARVYGAALPDIDPVSALLEEVRRSAGHVAALAALVAEVEAQAPDGTPAGQGGLWAGVTREVEGPGGIIERERRPGYHVVLRAYNEERDHLVRACAAAKTAGAQQEAVDMARALGAGFGRLLDAIFAALELSEYQRGLVAERVPPLLREYDPEAGSGVAS
jgi:P27 family predicted phage terminase small subunit